MKYLVKVLKTYPSNIKYKIITNRALRPDTFNNFEEKQAKLLANNYIGMLGVKYKKTNNGFTCTDFETAINMWTGLLNENLNISVDH